MAKSDVIDLPVNQPPSIKVDVTPMDMLDRAIAAGMGIDVLTKLMDLQERWEKNKARRAFDEALSSAKAEIPIISKNRTVDFTSPKGRTNYRYEDLAEVSRTVTPILGKNGLSFRFRTTSAPNEPITVTCIISHRDGHFEENSLSAGRDDSGNKNPIQQVGSTVTYLQRMTLKAALGLAASDDDDGKMAGGVITADQVANLQRIIKEVDVDEAKVLTFLKVEKLQDVTVGQYDKAVHALEQWAQKKAGAKK